MRKHGPVSPGQVAVTEAGQLPCKWVIHAVGPLWRGGNSKEDAELWDAMWNCFVWASKLHARSIAIPALGSTFLGFQQGISFIHHSYAVKLYLSFVFTERCAYLLVDCIAKFFHKHPQSPLREIRIVNLSETVTDAMVFEVVGKFTSGCETSESDRDSSDYDEDDEVDEEEEGDEAYDAAPPPAPTTTTTNEDNLGPMPVLPQLARTWLQTWRRQSIA